jgi:hypothetical protein
MFRRQQSFPPSSRPRPHFDKDLLPFAEDYFRDLFGPLRFGRNGWAKARCPVHGADRNPSLSVHLSGAWRCHRCDESGGDIISFEMFCSGADFRRAVQALGAWRS